MKDVTLILVVHFLNFIQLSNYRWDFIQSNQLYLP
jgi:hypothetical protein